ncbi:hypothetical protein EK0264_11380 [Epidermidibacterium keratini]|uniref:Uncharacterized protein n=1 Tax=Epidermidibacterium keratini TaxID=1891644 RepID=A0A7L4YQJ7_9ACTN|nr:hypothetical protein EK0264_11380 [Epidermidibacterium keratini]
MTTSTDGGSRDERAKDRHRPGQRRDRRGRRGNRLDEHGDQQDPRGGRCDDGRDHGSGGTGDGGGLHRARRRRQGVV